MPHATHTVSINAPIERVFAFFADGANNPKWRPGVTEISLASGAPDAVGAIYSQKVKGPGGRSIPADFTWTVVDKPARLEFQVTTGPARPHGVFELKPVGNGTTVIFSLDIKVGGFMKLMSPMVSKTARTEVACLDNAKRVIEALQ